MSRRVRLPDGLGVAYDEWGSPTGEPVVLLHGYADSHRFFEPLVEHLSSRLRVLAPTQRGHGDSDKPVEGYDLATLAADVVSFLDAMAVDSAVLVGHSSGGLVAQQAEVGRMKIMLADAERDLAPQHRLKRDLGKRLAARPLDQLGPLLGERVVGDPDPLAHAALAGQRTASSSGAAPSSVSPVSIA